MTYSRKVEGGKANEAVRVYYNPQGKRVKRYRSKQLGIVKIRFIYEIDNQVTVTGSLVLRS